MAKKPNTRKTPARGLGRGLSALLGDLEQVEAEDPAATPGGAPSPVPTLPVDKIVPNPNQPRRDFVETDLAELAASIAERGIIQPVIVRPAPDSPGQYQIVAGERRWRAAQRAQLHDIPVVIRALDDQDMLELAIIENVQRAGLNAIEEAMGYAQLVEKFSYTQEALAKVIGKSRSHLANTMRLLVLPEDVQRMVRDNRLSAGHARAIINAPDPAALARETVAKGFSVRQTEAAARKAARPSHGTRPGKSRAPGAEKDADTRMLEGDLSAAIGMRVDIRHGIAGDFQAGEMRITYKSLEDLDRLCQKLAE